LLLLGRQRSDDAESFGRVVQGEAGHQQSGQRDLALRRAATDGETLAEVVQADSDRDQERQPAGRRPRVTPAQGQLVGGHSARAQQRDVSLAGEPALVPSQAQQPHSQPGKQQRTEPEHWR
jgi:hypothetical protein